MSHSRMSLLSQRQIDLASLHTSSRTGRPLRLATLALETGLYEADPAVRAAVNRVLEAGKALVAAIREHAAQRKALTTSIIARDVAQRCLEESLAALEVAMLTCPFA